MNKFSNIGARMKLAALLFTLLFGYLSYHLYGVQIARHEELYAKAKSKYTCVTTKTGKRGEIYDHSGNLLVGNAPCADICADPTEIGDEAECMRISEFFAKELGSDKREIFARLSEKTMKVKGEDGVEKEVAKRFAVIETKVDFDLAERLKLEVDNLKFKGISFREATKRYYPKNQLLANILGYTNLDRDKVVAVIGLERFFDQPMKSTKTVSEFERARDGLPLVYGNANINEVKDGLNIYLTVREPIQAILEEELDNMMAKYSPRAAYAIMADPYTGDILAVAQRPTFNPNDRSSMSPDGWRNRIAEDTFEPGSTMKPFTIASAMDWGVVTPSTSYFCEKGRWLYCGKILRDSHPLETLTVSQIIQKSSNIGTAKIALDLGDKRVHDNLRAFGFGERTGVPLNPETAGIFRPLKKWDGLSITRFTIGQGIAVSPLQLVRGYCALANGGHPLKLRLVDRIENASTGIVRKMPSEEAPCVYKNPETAKKIVEMMKLVTQEGGTATTAAVKGYRVAGKTGTSQKCVNGVYSNSQFFATFVGFVPADKPEFVLMVTADEPKNAHYGGTVAGPFFSAIAERTLKYMDIPPECPEQLIDPKAVKQAAKAEAKPKQEPQPAKPSAKASKAPGKTLAAKGRE